jgi:hypothetical protein
MYSLILYEHPEKAMGYILQILLKKEESMK